MTMHHIYDLKLHPVYLKLTQRHAGTWNLGLIELLNTFKLPFYMAAYVPYACTDNHLKKNIGLVLYMDKDT